MRNFTESIRQVAKLLLLTAGAWFASAANAQNLAPVEVGRIARPQLVIAAPGDTPVRLQQVAVHAEVSGSLAITEVALTFYNPNRRVLEGELQFPLLAGQNVLGFALDVNGRLRDAVPVDKARGQAVFEDITRVRVDPGLLQVTQGNNFKLRVYPIPAQGTRQVLIRYAETLTKRAGRIIYRLPLEYADTLDSFRLDLNVAGAQAAPKATRGQLDGLNFAARAATAITRRWRANATPAAACSNSIFRSATGRAGLYASLRREDIFLRRAAGAGALRAARAAGCRRAHMGQLGLGGRARSRARIRACSTPTSAACKTAKCGSRASATPPRLRDRFA